MAGRTNAAHAAMKTTITETLTITIAALTRADSWMPASSTPVITSTTIAARPLNAAVWCGSVDGSLPCATRPLATLASASQRCGLVSTSTVPGGEMKAGGTAIPTSRSRLVT